VWLELKNQLLTGATWNKKPSGLPGHIYIYIYIYILQRERERETHIHTPGDGSHGTWRANIYKHAYTYIHTYTHTYIHTYTYGFAGHGSEGTWLDSGFDDELLDFALIGRTVACEWVIKNNKNNKIKNKIDFALIGRTVACEWVRNNTEKWRHCIHIYIYIYTYVCVCVCVYVCIYVDIYILYIGSQ
jgi:hypothetical protein